MGDKTVTLASSQQSLDLNTLRSRINELRDVHRSCDEVSETSPSDSEELMKDCALELQRKITQLLSEVSDVDSLTVEDLDEYLEHLKGELSSVETENATISDEIQDLSRRYVEDSNRLGSDLEGLNCHLDFITAQVTSQLASIF
ncbi:unnamed protein product [Ilex paraguariensis]|uniref:Uncharacterized protein n=1 Tax=Ilex paraguariensis TaxID=185542 RepID=A0ABC8RYR3_9AQUA